jgi:hypothetical protein
MRALTGYDRVTLSCGEERAESSRGAFGGAIDPKGLPVLVADSRGQGVGLFPRHDEDSVAQAALLRALRADDKAELARKNIGSMLRVPFDADGLSCEFRCENRTPRAPNFELHAAAELFAQMFAMRLAIQKASNR